MTGDISNVKPIRKGLSVGKSKLEPEPSMVEDLEYLLSLAKTGELVELCYVALTGDSSRILNNIQNVSYGDYIPHIMFSELTHLTDMYKEENLRPILE